MFETSVQFCDAAEESSFGANGLRQLNEIIEQDMTTKDSAEPRMKSAVEYRFEITPGRIGDSLKILPSIDRPPALRVGREVQVHLSDHDLGHAASPMGK